MLDVISICWCGTDRTNAAPHPAYIVCTNCGTARLRDASFWSPGKLFGDRGIYGKHYWYQHQEDDLRFPNIDQRAIDDLPQRCLHWVDLFLGYVLPGCSVLEVGCGHGGFLKLLCMAGYEAHGLEVNEEIVQMGRARFGCDVRCGQLSEDLMRELGIDVVAMFDVLEHLPDPISVMRAAASGGRRDLVCFIQTPCMRDDRSPDWLMFQPPEHLYLYTEQSITRLLTTAGFAHVRFEPALFGGDMQVIASQSPLRGITLYEREQALLATPDGRVVHAMLKMSEESERLRVRNQQLSVEATILRNQQWSSRFRRLVRGEIGWRRALISATRIFAGATTTDDQT